MSILAGFLRVSGFRKIDLVQSDMSSEKCKQKCFWDVGGVKIFAVRLLCKICISFSPGLFSLKRKIEDAVQHTEKMAPTALQIEEAKWIKLDGLIRDYDLWDDPAKSYDVLVKLADIARAVDALRDLTYKAEEGKLITQLVEMDAINYALFE